MNVVRKKTHIYANEMCIKCYRKLYMRKWNKENGGNIGFRKRLLVAERIMYLKKLSPEDLLKEVGYK